MENFPNMCLTCAIFSSETSRAAQTFSFSDQINERNTLLLSRCLDWSHNVIFSSLEHRGQTLVLAQEDQQPAGRQSLTQNLKGKHMKGTLSRKITWTFIEI